MNWPWMAVLSHLTLMLEECAWVSCPCTCFDQVKLKRDKDKHFIHWLLEVVHVLHMWFNNAGYTTGSSAVWVYNVWPDWLNEHFWQWSLRYLIFLWFIFRMLILGVGTETWCYTISLSKYSRPGWLQLIIRQQSLTWSWEKCLSLHS